MDDLVQDHETPAVAVVQGVGLLSIT